MAANQAIECPETTPAYHEICKYLMNCPLAKDFTKTPSMVYQNLLMEFGCTAVATQPNLPTDDSEVLSLKEYKIKFLVMNGTKPLTLDYKTFVESTGLDYAKGIYVSHPSLEAVLDGNYSSTKQVNSIQKLFAYCLLIRTKVDIGEIIYSDIVTRLTNKSRQRYVSYPRYISCALAVLLGPDYTQDENFGSSPTILSNSIFLKDPSKVTPIEFTDFIVAVNKHEHSVNPLPFSIKKKKGKSQTMTPTLPRSQGPEALGSLPQKRKKPNTIPDAQDLERNIQLAGTGLPSTLDEGTHKSQPLLEGTTTDPKDSGGNVQSTDKGSPSMDSNEGLAKTTPCPKGPLRDKDSEGNKPPADIEPINPTVVDPSRTGAEYQVDETQSTRLRYQTLTENKGKTSSEVEPDPETLQLTTLADIQAYLLSEDELAQESDEDEVFVVGDDMEEDTQADEEEHQSPSPNKDKPEPSHSPETQTDKLVQATIDSLDKTATDKVNLRNALNGVTDTLKAVQDAVKDDPTLNKKVIEATEAYTKNLSALTELLSLSSNSLAWNLGPRMTAAECYQAAIISSISSLRHDTSEIKSIMTEIYQAFKGENDAQADTNEPPSHTEGEHVSMEDDKGEEEPTIEVTLIESSSKPPLTDPNLEIPVSQIEGKAIATDDQPKHTKEQIKAHMNKEEQIKKAAKEAKKFKMTKIELIEVVQEEAEKIGLDPKTIICAKANFGVTELDELGLIIQKKKNIIVKDLMTSLGKRYERLKKIPEELRIQSALPSHVPEQAPSESSGRKRKHMELEPKIKVPGLECNRSLPEGVPFVNNMVIEEPEYEIFFTDVFSLKLRKLIAEHPDQEKLKSKRVKLKALGYKSLSEQSLSELPSGCSARVYMKDSSIQSDVVETETWCQGERRIRLDEIGLSKTIPMARASEEYAFGRYEDASALFDSYIFKDIYIKPQLAVKGPRYKRPTEQKKSERGGKFDEEKEGKGIRAVGYRAKPSGFATIFD
ncbi:hypothetical protein Tco_0499510 [Tanacetum coccineum]